GGDCANYVSQTLIARGWEQRSDWYNRSAGAEHSATWTYCPTMDPWLTTNAAEFGLTRRSLDERDKVKVGDLTVISAAIPETPIADDSSLDKRLDWRFLDLRNRKQNLIFRIQTTMEHAFRTYWV
ncbi:amidase domain-containing protein, partial [Bacillus sp. S34]|nr:amidase domain-containing protein [Bacillus sp. S34]